MDSHTPLGIRFWEWIPDPLRAARAGGAIADREIRDGLVVLAWALSALHRPVRAQRSSAGAYVFHGLPGLHSVEYPDDRVIAPGSHEYLISVEDRLDRFLPMIFGLALPLWYGALFGDGGSATPASPPSPPSPPVGGGRGAYLFTAPSRHAPAGMAAIRADLWDPVARRPAAYAVLELELIGIRSYGVADGRGRVQVLLPYPLVERLRLGSPPGSNQGAVTGEQWPVTVRVRYQPSQLLRPLASHPDVPPPWQTLPTLGSIMAGQAYGFIERTLTSPPQLAPTMVEDLVYGESLTLRSVLVDGRRRPHLWVHPG